jgi:hypothetical protein
MNGQIGSNLLRVGPEKRKPGSNPQVLVKRGYRPSEILLHISGNSTNVSD